MPSAAYCRMLGKRFGVDPDQSKADLKKAVGSATPFTLAQKINARVWFMKQFGATHENYHKSAHCKKHRPEIYDPFADDLPMDLEVALYYAESRLKAKHKKAVNAKLKKRRKEVR